VRVDRPPPGEEINRGAVTEPRQAASLMLLRDSAEGPEVLLVERNPNQRFMGGAWVFPGGAVHAEDADHAGAAVRELEEEAGIVLPMATPLVGYSRWITPAEVKIRFDTWFFLAEAPPGARAIPDGGECVDARWLRPGAALEAHGRDELMLVFPTIRHLEELAAFESVQDGLEKARVRKIEPIAPRVVTRGGTANVLLPGEPGYDEA
jgi:8-oxo-dGTP pyrophosphatase MutT (NUDIX family)